MEMCANGPIDGQNAHEFDVEKINKKTTVNPQNNGLTHTQTQTLPYNLKFRALLRHSPISPVVPPKIPSP